MAEARTVQQCRREHAHDSGGDRLRGRPRTGQRDDTTACHADGDH
jgi:hypothetical protein